MTRYQLDQQVGFLLRVASQLHRNVFERRIEDGLSPMQFSLLARLSESGRLSQNDLGRQISTDGATVKGIVERLAARGLIHTARSEADRRRLFVELTPAGREVYERNVRAGLEISEATLAGLTREESQEFLRLIRKLIEGI